MLVLTHLVMSYVKWTPRLVVLHESDDGTDSDDVDEDEDASLPSDDEMSTWFTYTLSFVTKKRE